MKSRPRPFALAAPRRLHRLALPSLLLLAAGLLLALPLALLAGPAALRQALDEG